MTLAATAQQQSGSRALREDAEVADAGRPQVLGYITSRFPHVTETFIVRELDAVRALGHGVRLYPLRRQRPAIVQPAAQEWVDVASWTGQPLALLAAHVAACVAAPRAYLRVWRTILIQNSRRPGDLMRATYVIAKAVRIARMVQREGVQHVHAHYATHPALAAWVVHQLTGVPYSVTVHAHDVQLRNPMLRQKLVSATAVVAVSEKNRERIAALAGQDLLPRTAVVHCGVDVSRYASLSAATPSSGRCRIAAIGSLQEYKGHTYLLEACRLLRADGVDVLLTIVGEGHLETALRRQVSSSGLSDCVQLVGPLDEHGVMAVLAVTDCFVQSSVVAASGQTEGIPVALMEAMAAGVAVVATRVSGVPELVQHERTGLLVPPRDPAALAEGIRRVLADPQGARRRSADAQVLVRTEFDLDTNARRLSGIFATACCNEQEAS